jgi:uncharacterized protein (TIGR03545 family)
MTKWLRWSGLGAFAALTILIGCFWLLLVDGLVERLIEKTGTAVVGARVELDSADVSLLPLGLTLHRLQVTNPDEPMRNAVEIERLAMGMDGLHLLQRKVLIEEMAAEKIRLDTPRRTSGALSKKSLTAPQEKKTGPGLSMPALQIPDVKEVLGRETLRSLELAADFTSRLARDKTQWQQRLAELPDQQKLNDYKTRLQNLKKSGSGLGGLLAGASEAAAVQQELKADLARLQGAQNDFNTASAAYQQQLSELKNAPQQDIKRLVAKYGLSPQGLGNMGTLLFGDKIGAMVKKGVTWYEKAQPLLARRTQGSPRAEVVKPLRGKGVMVRFQEKEPLPDFLIRTIKATVALDAGNFNGTITNVTPDQEILGAPLGFTFSGAKLAGIGALSLDGVVDRVRPGQGRDLLNLKMRDYTIDTLDLVSSGELPIALESALADLALKVKMQGRDLDADLRTSLRAATLTATPGTKGNLLTQALADAVSGITKATVNAKITGTLDDYTIAFQSDLDAVLQKALGTTLDKQTARFEQELREAVLARVKGPLAEASAGQAGLGDISTELTQRLQLGNTLLR